MLLLYGKPLARIVERAIVKYTVRMRQKPTLAVVLAGNNRASLNYVKRKGFAARAVRCNFAVHQLPASASETRVILLIKKLNKNKSVNGIIVQLPLPAKFNTQKILSAIAPEKDVDNLRGDSPFVSPSVQAIWHMLGKAGRIKRNTPILVVGHGRLIGKPLHTFLLRKGFTNVAVADKTTKNISALTARADAVISAVGKPGLIKKVKKGAIVIDAGAGFFKGKIKGDVDVARVSRQAKIVTPVPGGVGPLTVAYLFKNLLRAFLK
ncbi:bifunctional 5,10-methylenetetrahydrofolate dehydrogenase/5,10-methenyltetrahydrofolate cyclohydrolase [Candidatus Azambacteria bacterium]|nr:bifunctional 5,10-methylenetetrahydrofolate dehydrogenase/5,10-methenyltetrahydrofolate cyclohydrolase [Candidatus Azambacteria bacterium]MBI3685212.1 bifunctional 5,10-methylenetetrahydrofolate dehydrogenase/5,10-methenyltetrahydrofolate cyclohydrolase [Candidatus Azambacteria bacterium]